MEFASNPEFWLAVGQIIMIDMGALFVLSMGKWLARQQGRELVGR